MKQRYIPMAVIRRLPRYYRYVSLLREQGVQSVSSRELSELMGLYSSSQIRQDFNLFGEFGRQGFGYDVEKLHKELQHILGLDDHYPAILVGAGKLGKTVATQDMFDELGFDLKGIFDSAPELAGETLAGLPVLPSEQLENFLDENPVSIAILCVPKEAAAELMPLLMNKGIQGVWNFSHFDISNEYPNISVENVHLSDSLMTLCYKVSHEDFR